MLLVRRYNSLVCITAFLAALAYCAADDNTFFLAVLSIIGCALGWYAGRAERPWALPRWVVNLLMLAAIIDATLKVLSSRTTSYWLGSSNAPIVSTLSQFLLYILLAKLFDRRTPRDEAHLLSLSIFVVVGAVLTSNTLVVGVLILLFAPCIICTAMLHQLVGGARAVEDWTTARGLQADEPALDLPAPSRRRFRRDFLAASAAAVSGTLVLATIAFVLMPRGIWKDALGGFGKLQDGAVVGFTDQAKLGQSGILRNQDNDTPILNVRLSSLVNGKQEDLGEMRGTLYLRGAVKNTYHRESRSWEFEPITPRRSLAFPGPGNEDLSDITGGLAGLDGGGYGFETSPTQPLRLADPSRAQILIRQEFTLLHPIREHGYFFSIWRPIQFNTNEDTLINHPGREAILRAAHVASSSGIGGVTGLDGYSVTSAMEYSDPREPAREGVSFDSPVVRSIAEKILQERAVPLDPADRDAAANRRVAQAFVDYLRSGYRYSREMTEPLPGEDPIDMFLTRTKAGHCEYFASAMVALCQSVGLDARYVAGYIGTEFNRVTRVYVVRESSAHAWAEVRIAPGRWQTVDPSPPDAIDLIRERSTGILSRLRQWYDALNFTWSSAVISFDVSKQERIIGSPEGLPGRIVRRVGDFFSSLRRLPAGVVPALRAALIAVVVLVLVIVVPRAWRTRKRAARLSAAGIAAADPVMARLLDQAGFYREALVLLSRSDLAKPAFRPPVLHARTLLESHPPAARDFATVADLYYRLRFARRPLTDSELADANAALARLAAHLRPPAHAPS
jgi:transglutaminase-like putative cysteine protease